MGFNMFVYTVTLVDIHCENRLVWAGASDTEGREWMDANPITNKNMYYSYSKWRGSQEDSILVKYYQK